MPRRVGRPRKTHRKKTGGRPTGGMKSQRRVYHRKGKGISDWVKEKAWKFNSWMKEHKPISRVLDIPIIGWA